VKQSASSPCRHRSPPAVIRIAISPAAFDAIAWTLALGTVACEPQPNEKGERLIWIEERQLDKLNSIRRPGESYSEAIIRLAALWEGFPTGKRRRLRNVQPIQPNLRPSGHPRVVSREA
jgi:hypothetical protein